MEQQAEYRTMTSYIPKSMMYCKCGKHLGNEIEVNWYHQRRGFIKSNIFLRMIDGETVAKMFVRGEIICACGHREVWNG